MIYLLYSDNNYLLEKETNKIIAKEKIDEISIIRYDYQIDNVSTILEDAKTVSLFNPNKAIIVNNAIFCNRGKGTEEDINKLMEYIKNPNPDTVIIFINPNATVDNTKKITKLIKEKGSIKELSKTNIDTEVKELFNGYEISNSTIKLLTKRVGEDLSILSQEIDKIKTFKLDDNKITDEDIKNLTSTTIDTNIFIFIDKIINKEKNSALEMYHEMLKEGEEPIKMIALLASKFRLMFQACELSKKGWTQADISSLLGVHTYPVQLAIQSGLRYPSKTIIKYMRELSELDIQIKTGKMDPNLGLELFLLKV